MDIGGLYGFDKASHRWILCPTASLLSDDSGSSPTTDTCFIPERCQIVTWNILHDHDRSADIHSDQRYSAILQTLRSLEPDLVCLQGVTMNFLDLLLDQAWLQEENYYLIITRQVFPTAEPKTYGQLMLMRNFRPRALTIYPCQLLSGATKGLNSHVYIIARFNVSSTVTIDLVNLHLQSGESIGVSDERRQTLEYLLQTMHKRNYMLVGDFSFGDEAMIEESLLEQYQYAVHDLWKGYCDLSEVTGTPEPVYPEQILFVLEPWLYLRFVTQPHRS